MKTGLLESQIFNKKSTGSFELVLFLFIECSGFIQHCLLSIMLFTASF